MARHPYAAAALIAALSATPAAAREPQVAPVAVCPAPATSSLSFGAEGALEDRIAQLTDIIADLSDRLDSLESALGEGDGEYDDYDEAPEEGLAVAAQAAARPQGLAARARQSAHMREATPRGPPKSEATAKLHRTEVALGTTT